MKQLPHKLLEEMVQCLVKTLRPLGICPFGARVRAIFFMPLPGTDDWSMPRRSGGA